MKKNNILSISTLSLFILIISCSSSDESLDPQKDAPAPKSTNYESYLIGSSSDIQTSTQGGVCLMGGATENDEAMKWFLKRANGGDVLILRTSGSDGYNKYMFSSLGIKLNSVETIVCKNKTASQETYIQDKIKKAEAIWIAGGDQYEYVSYWRNSPIAELINDAIKNRNIAIGGTSAGMAIMGKFYFSAKNGTISSNTALNNPYDNKLSVDSAEFIQNFFLSDVITDTHYDNPDRKGRHVAFLARIYQDFKIQAKGIACDEYTAVCIDSNGKAVVYGNSPDYDDNAYFIQINPELSNPKPEKCEANKALSWNRNKLALKVYEIQGTKDGKHFFDLTDWKRASGGNWNYWYVENGNLHH